MPLIGLPLSLGMARKRQCPLQPDLGGLSSKAWPAVLAEHSRGHDRTLVMCVPQAMLKLKRFYRFQGGHAGFVIRSLSRKIAVKYRERYKLNNTEGTAAPQDPHAVRGGFAASLEPAESIPQPTNCQFPIGDTMGNRQLVGCRT